MPPVAQPAGQPDTGTGRHQGREGGRRKASSHRRGTRRDCGTADRSAQIGPGPVAGAAIAPDLAGAAVGGGGTGKRGESGRPSTQIIGGCPGRVDPRYRARGRGAVLAQCRGGGPDRLVPFALPQRLHRRDRVGCGSQSDRRIAGPTDRAQSRARRRWCGCSQTHTGARRHPDRPAHLGDGRRDVGRARTFGCGRVRK